MKMLWIAARRRESQTWVIIGGCPWEVVEKRRPNVSAFSRRAYMKVRQQRHPYSFECPEYRSCFFDAHKVIEAETKEEAQKQCL